MKKLVLSMIAATTMSAAFAGPAMRRIVKMQQADGTEVEVILSGDENGVIYTDPLSGKVLKRTVVDAPVYAPIRRTGQTPLTGTPHYPVILIESPDLLFSNICMNGDTAHHYDSVEELYNDFFNGDNYKFMGCNGSISQYFSDQSYGQYKPQFDIIGKVTLSQNHSYYGANHSYTASGIKEALTLAYEAGMISAEQIASWDNNNDGMVDAVYAIFAGYNETYCGKTEYIWSHNSAFSKLSLGDNLPKFSTYVCSSELYGSPGSDPKADGIGSAVHEFCHVLGLPDFYDVNKAIGDNAVYGMDFYSLMDQGMYNNKANCPTSLTAFERESLGWITIEELPLSEDSIYVELPTLNDNKKAYIYRNPNNPNEAFIFENHNKSNWDTFFGGFSSMFMRGMLITHLDYVANLWSSNRINVDCNHPHYTPLPADGMLTAYNYRAYQVTNLDNEQFEQWYADYRVGLTNDLWPCGVASTYIYRSKFQYGGPYTTLSKETTPKAVFFDGTEAGFVIENIAEHFADTENPSDLITFTLKPFGYTAPAVSIDDIETSAAEGNGLKMIDGQLIIIKNGKKFDLQGRNL